MGSWSFGLGNVAKPLIVGHQQQQQYSKFSDFSQVNDRSSSSRKAQKKENQRRACERKHEMSVWNEGIIPNRTKVIIVYPTVNPEVVIVPIVSSIFIFPIVAFLIICCLKKRAARARQKARLAKRETPYGDPSCASMARFSPPPGGGHSTGRRFTTADVEMTTCTADVTSDSYNCYHSVQPKTPTPTSSSQELVLGVLPILKVLETGMNSIRKS